jgi:hypothetical protein
MAAVHHVAGGEHVGVWEIDVGIARCAR